MRAVSSLSGTAAVILAAGSSSRLGRPKQSQLLGGETLVERAMRLAQEARLSPVIVVLRPDGDLGHSLQERGALIALNDRPEEGVASSIRLGVNVAGMLKASGVVLMTCDQVMLLAEHLRALSAQPERITGSAYAGKVGIPAYFPAAAFPELLRLQGDTGARELLRDAASVPAEDLALDVDTQQDFDRARSLIEQRSGPKTERKPL
jgi:CTP:molybdopterin cytidylyltransferase MocA